MIRNCQEHGPLLRRNPNSGESEVKGISVSNNIPKGCYRVIFSLSSHKQMVHFQIKCE